LSFAAAQIYSFDKTPLPEPRTLKFLYTFYLYSPKDDPRPDKVDEPATIDFHALVPNYMGKEDMKTEELEKYRGLQLGLLLYDDLQEAINPERFCCFEEDAKVDNCKPNTLIANPRMETHTIRFTSDPHFKAPTFHVKETGAYMLIMSNCGELKDAVVSGSIVAKNPHGFLPGDEVGKLPFYQKLSLVYLGVGMVWMCSMLRWWKEIFRIHICITIVVWLGMVESFLWQALLNHWNRDGSRGAILFFFAVSSTVAKMVFSYMLVLVGCMGWGITKPNLDVGVMKSLWLVAFLYVVLGTVRELVLAHRHAYSLSPTFLILCLIPISVLNGGFFYWIATSLVDLIMVLEERKQTAKLHLFRNLSRVLVLALVIGGAAMLYQVFVFSKNISHHWSEQWLFTDGIPHMLFLGVLMAMMWLWRPHSLSSEYMHIEEVALDEKEKEPCIGNVDEENDFWERTHGDIVAKKE
jgi:hypothetical protein